MPRVAPAVTAGRAQKAWLQRMSSIPQSGHEGFCRRAARGAQPPSSPQLIEGGSTGSVSAVHASRQGREPGVGAFLGVRIQAKDFR